MATHSSVLAWRIPGMGEPGGLPSMGLHGVAQSRTQPKRLSSSSSSTMLLMSLPLTIFFVLMLTLPDSNLAISSFD